MTLKKFHDPAKGILKVVGLMSGSGTNLRKVIEHEIALNTKTEKSPFHVVAIFSDNAESQAPIIGKDFNLPVIIRDIRAYYRALGLKRSDLTLRPGFDAETLKALAPFDASCAVYAGYMSISSNILINGFTGVNVHPGDLTVIENGKRKWTGGHSVLDAIKAGEASIRSTTHFIEPEIDGGRILLLSKPLKIEMPKDLDFEDMSRLKNFAEAEQTRLKQVGDWEILPRTIEFIASGRFSQDNEGNLYFDEKPIPFGIQI